MSGPPLPPPLADALHGLVADGTLSAQQAGVVAERLARALPGDGSPPTTSAARPAPPASPGTGRLAEIAGYAGAALLLGASALFVSSEWDGLADAARFGVLSGLTVLLLGSGAVIGSLDSDGLAGLRALGRREDSTRRRLVSVLWSFAAGAAAGAAAVVTDEHAPLVASIVGLAVAASTYAVVASSVGQLACWGGAIALLCTLVAEAGDDPGTTPYAVVLVALGAGWAAMALVGVLRERETGLALGAWLALLGAQLPVFDDDYAWLGYLLTALVALAGYAGYLRTRSWSVLAVGVVATTLAVPEAVHDWTGGSVSAAGSLLVAGLTLLAASAAGLRLRHEVAADGHD